MDLSLRPLAISENEQLFYQLSFQHLSCLFEYRGKVSSLAQAKHVDNCKKTIRLILNSVRQYGESFVAETWNILLKVMLGISDYLLRENSSSYLTEQLIESVLWTLFECWLRSSVVQVELWSALEVHNSR